MIYLDACAIVKLIRPEPQSASLSKWLFERQDEDLISSTLAEIEVSRALRRADPGRLAQVPTILSWINRIEIDATVRATAATYPDVALRSLEAVHLASAHTLVLEGNPLTAFVTYDQRLLAAAEAIGLPVAAPS